MSKRDQLGRGSSFGSAAGARSARRDAIDQTIRRGGNDETALTDLPVTLVSENPDNPRNHLRNLDETVESVREVGIILPIVVATVEAYLHDRPDRAGDLDDGAQYVVIDGHRRLEASRRVGLAMIPVRVDNARVATDETLLEAAFVANYHRDDMTDLEEAHALKQLVDYYGSQTKAAKRLGIPQNTISSKLSLLKLTPELQKDLMTGERKVEHVRNLGKLSPEEQRRKADERAVAAEARREAPRPAPALPREPEVVEQSAGPADYHAVIITESAAQAPEPSPAPPAAVAEPTAGSEARAETVPEPRTAPAPAGKRFPYDNPGEAALLMKHKMDEEMHLDTFRLMLRTEQERNPERLNKVLDSELSRDAI